MHSLFRLALITLVCFVIVGIFFFFREKPCANFNETTLQTSTQTIAVALAQTSEQQSKGLGGCKSIPENSGMYFTFTDAQEHTFWMKDMLIPIDIIWIQGGIVVGVERNVPNMPLDTPDSDLSRYKSPVPVDAVLEVGAGMAELYGIEKGMGLGQARSI